jgi:hypothetical protein
MIAALVAAILVFAAGFHFYWGFGGRVGFDAALPQRPDGQRVFTPGPLGAHLVGALLLAIVLVVAAQAGWLARWFDAPPPPATWLRSAVGLLAAVFLVRALGAFEYAGWFKRVRDTRFARFDTWFYCPLCLVLGLGIARLAWA